MMSKFLLLLLKKKNDRNLKNILWNHICTTMLPMPKFWPTPILWTHTTHAIFLTHAKILWTHTTHAKIWTHATHIIFLTPNKILQNHATHATHAKVWPTPLMTQFTHATHATHAI